MATCKYCQSKYEAMLSYCNCEGQRLAQAAHVMARAYITTLDRGSLLIKSPALLIEEAAIFITFQTKDFLLRDQIRQTLKQGEPADDE